MEGGGERVVIVAYDPSWPLRFAVERERLASALGSTVVAIEHVGSTAIPGLPAAPAIDVAAALHDVGAASEAVARLQVLGYERLPDGDVEGGFFLARRASATRAFHLFLTAIWTELWRLQLAFRDRLRGDPGMVREYAELKRRAVAGGMGPDAYAAAKGEFVRRAVGAG